MNDIIFIFWIVLFAFIPFANAETTYTLDACRQLALENNNALKNSRLDIESAEKNKNAAFTRYFPKISAGAMTFSTPDAVVNQSIPEMNLPVYDGNPVTLMTANQFAYFPGVDINALEKGQVGYISAVQPLFAGGRIITGNRLASLGRDVNRLKYAMLQNDVLLKTEEQYWQIISLYEKRKTIQGYEALLKQLLAQVENAYAAGLALKNDVLKVRQKLSEVKLNTSKLENGIQLASMGFCQYIGIAYDPSVFFSDQVTMDANPEILHVNHHDAVKARIEYQLLDKSLQAETLKSKLDRGKYMPEVAVGASLLYAKIDDFDAMDRNMIFAFTRIPISDWWESIYTIKERKIQEKMQANTVDENAELLMLQMEKSWRDVEDAHKQLTLSEISKSQAEENLKLSRDSYSNGIVDVSDLLEAQAIFQNAEDQYIEAKINCRIRQITYLQVTGRTF